MLRMKAQKEENQIMASLFDKLDQSFDIERAVKLRERQNTRKDICSFIEHTMSDDKGNPIKLSWIHRSWHRHIEYCFKHEKYAGILAPYASGKTVAVVQPWPLFYLGHNKNARIGIVSTDERAAKDRVMVSKGVIEASPEYREIFPHVEPDKSKQWTAYSLFVKRDAGLPFKDPSIYGTGVLSKATGRRFDLLIFDDVVDFNNTIKEPGKMPTVRESIQNMWLTRIRNDGGMCIAIGTAWHKDDAMQQLVKSDKFCFLIQRVSKDLSYIECEVTNHCGDYPIENITNFEELRERELGRVLE